MVVSAWCANKLDGLLGPAIAVDSAVCVASGQVRSAGRAWLLNQLLGLGGS